MCINLGYVVEFVNKLFISSLNGDSLNLKGINKVLSNLISNLNNTGPECKSIQFFKTFIYYFTLKLIFLCHGDFSSFVTFLADIKNEGLTSKQNSATSL